MNQGAIRCFGRYVSSRINHRLNGPGMIPGPYFFSSPPLLVTGPLEIRGDLEPDSVGGRFLDGLVGQRGAVGPGPPGSRLEGSQVGYLDLAAGQEL